MVYVECFVDLVDLEDRMNGGGNGADVVVRDGSVVDLNRNGRLTRWFFEERIWKRSTDLDRKFENSQLRMHWMLRMQMER